MPLLSAQGTGVGTQTVNWDGCIMERDTVNTITTTTPANLAIPSGALDIDINALPTDDASRWRPLLPQISWRRSAGTAARAAER